MCAVNNAAFMSALDMRCSPVSFKTCAEMLVTTWSLDFCIVFTNFFKRIFYHGLQSVSPFDQIDGSLSRLSVCHSFCNFCSVFAFIRQVYPVRYSKIVFTSLGLGGECHSMSAAVCV